MNVFIGAGIVGQEPKFTESKGYKILKFSIALDERYKDKAGEWKKKTTWVDCTKFGGNAESLAKIIHKGLFVVVRGSIAVDTYEKDGQKRKVTFVTVDDVQFGPKRDNAGASSSSCDEALATADGDDMPF